MTQGHLCPIDFGHTPYPCAFRLMMTNLCSYSDGQCIPMHMKKFEEASKPYATVTCTHCGHQITVNKREAREFLHSAWACSKCGQEQSIEPEVIQ